MDIRVTAPGSLCKLIAALCALALSGCASVPGPPVEHDPWEGYNRSMYQFNDAVDRNLLKPVAEVYDDLVPNLIKRGISNFFSNLDDLIVTFNDLLQGKGTQAVHDGLRFTLNTTVGIYGLFDVAGAIGMEKNAEDFGQTLGRWGVPSGPYLVLPFLGPSTLRDGPALVVDAQVDPTYEIERRYGDDAFYGAVAVRVVDTRARLLGASSLLETAALDPYAYFRDAWLARRRNMVYDGNPPSLPGADPLDPLDDPILRGGDPLDELDRLEQADPLDELDRLERIDELDRLDQMDELDRLEQMDELDRLERPDGAADPVDARGDTPAPAPQ